jgi:hypothetical protein
MLTYKRTGIKQEKRNEPACACPHADRRGNREVAMPEILPAVANVSRRNDNSVQIRIKQG